MIRTSLAVAVAVAVGMAPASAAILYSPGTLSLETTERQSVWGEGAAQRLSDTYFVGETWDTSFATGGIVGSVSTTRIPTPTYLAALGAWESCRALAGWLVDCGSRPRRETFTVTTDTRTGAQADVTTRGKVGFDLNYTLDAGSVAAQVDFDAFAMVPDVADVRRGESFSLPTASTFKDGTMNVQSPTAEASIDAILQAYAFADAKGCVFLAGCAQGSGVIFDIDEDRELVGIDPNQITFFDGFVPDGVEVKTPLAARTFTLGFDLATLTPEIEDEDAPIDDVDVTIELAQARTNIPIFNEDGGKVGDKLLVEARADILDLTVDLDTLFSGTGILPPGGVSLGFGPVGVGVDAYDFDAGPSFDMFQDVTLTPGDLLVDLEFSRPVEIGGQLVEAFSGVWDELPEMAIFGRTVVTPTFYTVADFVSSTGLQLGLELSMEFLKASLTLSAFGVDLLDLGLGPLVDETHAYDPEWAKFSIFDANYRMDAFDKVAGASFILDATPVPLPAGLPLIGIALGSLVLLRLREARPV